VVSGRWTVQARYGHEKISVSSAFANPKTSFALMRALQSASEPETFAFPPERFDPGRTIPPLFRLSPLSIAVEARSGLDRHDPLSGRIRYPPLQPRPAVSRLLELTVHDDDRAWQSSRSGDAFRSQLWGCWNEEDQHSELGRGRRLLAAPGALDTLLQRTGRDLVIWVRVQRIKEKYHRDPPCQ
jgi:hypothetical protein